MHAKGCDTHGTVVKNKTVNNHPWKMFLGCNGKTVIKLPRTPCLGKGQKTKMSLLADWTLLYDAVSLLLLPVISCGIPIIP